MIQWRKDDDISRSYIYLLSDIGGSIFRKMYNGILIAVTQAAILPQVSMTWVVSNDNNIRLLTLLRMNIAKKINLLSVNCNPIVSKQNTKKLNFNFNSFPSKPLDAH
jgi:hypothetical protein